MLCRMSRENGIPTETGRPWRAVAIALVVACTLAGLALTPPGGRVLAWIGETLSPRPAVGGPFSLVNHKGQRRTEKDFAGRPMLLFFWNTRAAPSARRAASG